MLRACFVAVVAIAVATACELGGSSASMAPAVDAAVDASMEGSQPPPMCMDDPGMGFPGWGDRCICEGAEYVAEGIVCESHEILQCQDGGLVVVGGEYVCRNPWANGPNDPQCGCDAGTEYPDVRIEAASDAFGDHVTLDAASDASVD